MRLVLATSDFKIHGLAVAGFPILLEDDMQISEPANSFLIEVCITNGGARSQASWAKYGQDIYDFLGFAGAKGVDYWRTIPRRGRPGPIEMYRNWALDEGGCSPSTVNQRLRTIRRFYDWCVREQIIDRAPYRTIPVRNSRDTQFLQHVDATGNRVETPHFMLKVLKKPLKILSKAQCDECLKALQDNEALQLLFRLMLVTGLRNREARTLPDAYVFNPARISRLQGKAFTRLGLDASEMCLKGSKDREIDVPVQLMQDLYWWSVKQRPKRIRCNAQGQAQLKELFITERGNAYSQNAIGDMFRALSRRVGYPVTPHMLRHTWATHTLHFLRRSNLRGDPLLYVQARLGHASLNTTIIYLHHLEHMDVELLESHNNELDMLFSGSVEGLTV